MEDQTYDPLKSQVGGEHYKTAAIQPVDFIVKNNIPFREGNAIKYIFRHRQKNGAQDIKKAIHYLQMVLKDYESGFSNGKKPEKTD